MPTAPTAYTDQNTAALESMSASTQAATKQMPLPHLAIGVRAVSQSARGVSSLGGIALRVGDLAATTRGSSE